MKKFFVFLAFYIFASFDCWAQTRSIELLVGKWEAVDAENSSGGLEVLDSARIYLVYGNQKKVISSYKADFTKSPVWFDFVIKDSTETISLKSLIQFINEDLIQWQVFENDIRPAHFTQSDGQTVYLRRKR